MAKDRVDIPVEVTGAEAAKKDLKGVAGAIEGVGDAGSKSAAGVNKASVAAEETRSRQSSAADASERLGQGMREVDSNAMAFATNLAGRMNPELASMIGLVADGVEGIQRMSGAMIGIVGVGAGLSALGAIFAQIQESASRAAAEIERVQEAQARQLQEGVALRTQVARDLAESGVSASQTQPALSNIEGLTLRGVPLDIARNAAVAAEIAQAESGGAFDAEEVARGIIAGGLQKLRLGGNRRELVNQVRQAIKRGRDNREFVDDFIVQTAPSARGEAPSSIATGGDLESQVQAAIGSELQRLARERPDLDEEERKIVERLARGASEADVLGEANLPPGVPVRRPGTWFQTTDLTVEDVRRLVNQVRGKAEDLAGDLSVNQARAAEEAEANARRRDELARDIGHYTAVAEQNENRFPGAESSLTREVVARRQRELDALPAGDARVIRQTIINVDTVYGNLDELSKGLGRQNLIHDEGF